VGDGTCCLTLSASAKAWYLMDIFLVCRMNQMRTTNWRIACDPSLVRCVTARAVMTAGVLVSLITSHRHEALAGVG